MSSKRTYELIWSMVSLVPRGRVATYGQIASEVGFPGQPRMVGYALHALPPRSGIPWHRIINSQGKISFPKESASYRRQRRLLRLEGVEFRRDVVDLDRFGWLR
ncbi:MAG TPA: methylated-DNA--[protein]-cysteine S-methyltransferase [Bacteroidota bacterium]|nr:methylated-DNA--[protein]-cysteine S-methyltransferase [Bacteroidota bacterium]